MVNFFPGKIVGVWYTECAQSQNIEACLKDVMANLSLHHRGLYH